MEIMAQNKEVTDTDVIILTNKNLESKPRLIKLILELRREHDVWVDVILLDNVCVRLGPGQKEAAVWPGTGNDDLNYLISTQRAGISLSGSAWFVIIP